MNFRISEKSYERYATIRLVAIAVILWMLAIMATPADEPAIAEFGAFPIPIEQVEITTITHSDGRKDIEKASVKPEPITAAVSVGSPVKAGTSVPSALVNAPTHVRAFVKRWLPIAADMFNRYDIPISSQLAQGGVESDWGRSDLSKTTNNFFGIKCKGISLFHNHSKCRRYHDDSPKDMFRGYNTAWESWKDHAYFMANGRYKPCLKKQSVASYCKCIADKGYASGAGYGGKLNNAIATYGLDTFDALTPAEAKAVAAKIKL